MKNKGHVINKIVPGSIADELDLEPGDRLIAINNKEIEDVFDYQFLVDEESMVLLVGKKNGEEWELEIEKDYEEDLGIEFDNGLMDEYKSCRNKCMFCFIDQMPEGMRETLYFKDDDSRLSFLQGNYITLTNMSDKDISRIIEYKLSPINISFHTTNPELRCKMLHNRFAGDALEKVDMLYEAGIEMNGQIVLCKGINDGEELERSIKDMSKYIPYLRSVSVVPVGLTKFREGLQQLEPFTKEDSREVLAIIHKWQDKLYKEHGTHFIHAGDEWYITAGEEFPKAENYDGYMQLENGVGMVNLLLDEFEEEYIKLNGDNRRQTVSIATGVSAYNYISKMASRLEEKFPNMSVNVYKIINNFFGPMITVSGLLTGKDLSEQLKDKALGDKLLLPCNVLRSGEDVFLDDITLSDLENTLQVKIDIVKSSGRDFIESVINPSA
jgi:putative radical SAM enzyme (TIGR03279 family)